jgi:hypothetical protein
MDHVVYVDAKAKDLQKLLDGKKRMIIRGAAGRKLPYGLVKEGDRLFFMPNDGSCLVQAWAEASQVINTGRLSEDESRQLIEKYQEELQLTPAQFTRWVGKRFLVLIHLDEVQTVPAFRVDRSAYGSMDDWLPVGEIEKVRLEPA